MVPNVGRFSIFQENRRFFQFLPECRWAPTSACWTNCFLISFGRFSLFFFKENHWFGFLPELKRIGPVLEQFFLVSKISYMNQLCWIDQFPPDFTEMMMDGWMDGWMNHPWSSSSTSSTSSSSSSSFILFNPKHNPWMPLWAMRELEEFAIDCSRKPF